MKQRKINFSTLRWVWDQTGVVRGGLAFLFIVKVLQGAEGIVFAFMLRNVVDAAAQKDWSSFRTNSIAIFGLVIFAIILYWCALFYTEKPTAKLTKHLRERAFGELLFRSYADVAKVHTGEWMTRINSDTGIVSRAVATIVPSTAGMLVQFACALISLFLLVPRVAWLMIPFGVGMLGISLLLRVRLKRYHIQIQESEGVAYGFLQESLSSMPVIRTYTKENDIKAAAGAKLERTAEATVTKARFIATCSSAVYAMIRLGYMVAVILCGARLLNDTMTYGMMVAILQLVRQIDHPMAEVSTAVPQFFNMVASAERLIQIEALESDYSGQVLPKEKARKFYQDELLAVGIRDGEFSYQKGGEKVLDGLNLEIKKGDYVAFTGQSGCGKSTTLSILMGLYKLDGGQAYVLGKDGGEQALTPEWRTLFAYVPQENLLLGGTVRDVVTFSEPAAQENDGRIWQALEIACAKDFVMELPQGLDTPLGERGAGLSEGQMQRIAIARAIYSGRPILMLDEATSALDENTERALLDNLKAVTDRTVLIITHRPAALRICNQRVEFGKKSI